MLDTAHVECVGELRPLVMLEQIDLWLVVMAIVRGCSWEAIVVIYTSIVREDVCRAAFIAIVRRVSTVRALTEMLTSSFLVGRGMRVWCGMLCKPWWLLGLEILDVGLLCTKGIIAAHAFQTSRLLVAHF